MERRRKEACSLCEQQLSENNLKGPALRLTEETSTKTTTSTTCTCMKQQFNKKGKEKETAGLNCKKWGIFTNATCIYFRRT